MTRTLLRLSGPDTRDFLQGLITNDVAKIDSAPIYAAMLTPQGKYLADFFVLRAGGDVLLDVGATLATPFMQRLTMYKLRAKVTITTVEDQYLHRGIDDTPDDGWPDPRHPALGWRAWRSQPAQADTVHWDAIRIQHLVPENGSELTPDSFILEHNFETLHGVDFRKGCYVGQEVTARMKHKTQLRKGLARVAVDGATTQGADIVVGEKIVGQLLTRAGDQAIAYLRFDRVGQDMTCGDARVTPLD
ncbi:MAG: folate-binding protein YgfZ [Paracoccaceae bacterium]